LFFLSFCTMLIFFITGTTEDDEEPKKALRQHTKANAGLQQRNGPIGKKRPPRIFTMTTNEDHGARDSSRAPSVSFFFLFFFFYCTNKI
jgi:hypothetical protein